MVMKLPLPPACRHLVLVDDDVALLSALKFSFETEGYLVRAFADGASALNAPLHEEAICLVLDERLPGPNGLDLLDQLRARGVKAPAILITTNPSLSTRQRATLANVEIVEKPLLGDALSLKVWEYASACAARC